MIRHKMYEKTFKSAKKIANGNNVTHDTKYTFLINKTTFTLYSVPPAHAPASVYDQSDVACGGFVSLSMVNP